MKNLAKHQLLLATSIIILLTIIAASFLPDTFYFVFIKILMSVGAGSVIFYISHNFLPAGKDEKQGFKNEPGGLQFTEIPPELAKVITEENVEENFERFLKTIFPLIKQTVVGNTVVLLMVNYYKEKFYIRYKDTDFGTRFNKEGYFDLNQGLFSVILKNKEALLENHLPDNENLLPYYSSKEILAKSFLGVPLFFNDFIVGVLCIDSQTEESFSREDLQILTEFGKVIAIQLVSSNKLYEYETENWTTKFLNEFSKGILKINSQEELWQHLYSSLKNAFDADRIIISEKTDSQKGKIIYVSDPTKGLAVGEEFPNNEGIMGWVLRKNQCLLVDDFSAKENYIPRFILNEQQSNEYRSLLAVPVSKDENAHIVISIESRKSGHFNDQHKKIVETMAYQIALFLDKLQIIEQSL